MRARVPAANNWRAVMVMTLILCEASRLRWMAGRVELRNLFSTLLGMGVLISTQPLMAQQKSPWPTVEWATSSPEDQGMSSEVLARLVDFGLFNNLDSLLVARHGHIVLEGTYAPFRAGLKHHVYSVTKSVTGTLVGIVLKEGLLDSVDRRMLDFFADRTVANLDDRKKEIRVRHLLDMTSGIDWKEPDASPESVLAMERSGNWQQFVLDRPMDRAPGTAFNYNSGDSHLLSSILTKLTGRTALDFAREKLFGPLGIEDVVWRHDPQGISAGGYGLYLQPRDMAKIGHLYLRNGAWEGKQVLPAAWIADIRKTDIRIRQDWASNLRYGSQFWVMPGRDAYFALGHHLQLIAVIPKFDIVLVATASARFPAGNGAPTSPPYSFDELIAAVVYAVKSEGPLPSAPAAAADLANRVREAAQERPSPPGQTSEMAKAVSGKTYRFPANTLNLKSIMLRLDEPQPSYEFEVDSGRVSMVAGRFGGPIGFDGHYRVGGRMPYGISAAKGTWLADGVSFVLELQTLGNDDAARVTHLFREKTVDVSIEGAGGFSLKLEGQAED